MDVTKPYKFIGFGAMYVTKPYKFIGFGADLEPSMGASMLEGSGPIQPDGGRRSYRRPPPLGGARPS